MLTINLDENLKIKLKKQAENKGHTIKEEITEIIEKLFIEKQDESINLAERIKKCFAAFKDVEIPEIL